MVMLPPGKRAPAWYNNGSRYLSTVDQGVNLLDSQKLELGTGQDATLYYDGTDTFLDLRAVGTGDLMIALAGSFPSPDPNAVHIWRGDASAVAASAAAFILEDDAAVFMQFLSPNNADVGFYFGDPDDNGDGRLAYDHANTQYEFRAAGVNTFFVNARGLALNSDGALGPVAGADNYMFFANGTPETTETANGAGIYAKDVTASGEMFAHGEDGTESQISPHPAGFLNDLPLTHDFPWAEHHDNRMLGKEMWVDMEGVVRAVEQLSGQSFVTVRNYPKASWDDNEEQKRLQRVYEREVARGKDRPEPPSYRKRPPPKWMLDRGVVSSIA